ncbi:TPA: hypothetical protein ANIA_11284 [Aspergillus nidulans FGSC A4]|uniref:Uncharacterized protein n=1 Tax=Emericella nidulans (strain FGSC A4 / ATCC 38163 / CBS 112.46 / NRRL 194 / M139) TaxID=227321 RepID=C8VUQ2_EMENI|nr:TPA: hypothetical protein ANIA_11284 [Aspergillus nidulans FGSC A4]
MVEYTISRFTIAKNKETFILICWL